MAWIDCHSEVRAQRIDSTGAVLWAHDGVPVCTLTSSKNFSRLASDGVGGAIVVWADERHGPPQIYAQHLGSSGKLLWVAEGLRIHPTWGRQECAQVIPDGEGGVVITWQDGPDVRAQRVDGSGISRWGDDGVEVCGANYKQRIAVAENRMLLPEIVPDGSSGVFIAWQDFRTGTADIYAQRVDGSGVPLWYSNGVPVCTDPGTQTFDPRPSSPNVVFDGDSGVLVAWMDDRDSSPSSIDWNIYAQRVDASGARSWRADGIAVCAGAGQQCAPRLISDGAQGAIVAWEDHREVGWNSRIYAQHLSASGAPHWGTDGCASAVQACSNWTQA